MGGRPGASLGEIGGTFLVGNKEKFLGQLFLPTMTSSWRIIKRVALGIACTCCLCGLGEMECRIRAVLITDYSP